MRTGRPRTRYPKPCKIEGCLGITNITGTAKGLCKRHYTGAKYRTRTKSERDRDNREGLRTCTRCLERKSFEEYCKKTGRCDSCRNARQRMIAYNLTAQEADDLEREHGGLCAICKGPPCKKKFLSVDHNHTTGQVRGLLCDVCNRAIGMLKDDVDLIRAAADYLERYRK